MARVYFVLKGDASAASVIDVGSDDVPEVYARSIAANAVDRLRRAGHEPTVWLELPGGVKLPVYQPRSTPWV